jgi:hypothetical protein
LAGVVRAEGHNLLCTLEREIANQRCVDQHEDGGVQADTQREDEDHGGAEPPFPGQHTHGESKVPHAFVGPSHAPRVPAGFFRLLEPAELDLRAAARIGVAEAGVLVRLNLPLEMGSKLVIELTFHVAAPQ